MKPLLFVNLKQPPEAYISEAVETYKRKFGVAPRYAYTNPDQFAWFEGSGLEVLPLTLPKKHFILSYTKLNGGQDE